MKRCLFAVLVAVLVFVLSACRTETVELDTGTITASNVQSTTATATTTAKKTTLSTQKTTLATQRTTLPTLKTTSPTQKTTLLTQKTTRFTSTSPSTTGYNPTTAKTINYDTLSFTPAKSTVDYFETLQFYDDFSEETVHYLFHEPLRDSGEPMPLVIFLHGKGDSVTASYPGTATPLVRSLMELENENYEYSTYTLVPSTPLAHEGQWTICQVVAFQTLLYDLIERYNIDEKRIYLSGVSMGGFMTCQLVSEMPDTFAAAVPLSGAENLWGPLNAHGTAFRIYHVASDPVVDVSCSRSLYQQLLDTNHPNVEYTEYPTGSHISPIYTVFESNRDAFFSWLFSQRRS